MGYAVRTHRYRYVEWIEWETKRVTARELYDHEFDSQEMQNLAASPKYADTTRELAGILDRGWESALPTTPESAP